MGFIFDVVDRVHANQALGQLLVRKIFHLAEYSVIGILDILAHDLISCNAPEKSHAWFWLACTGRKSRNEWPVKVAVGVAPVPVVIAGNELVAIDF